MQRPYPTTPQYVELSETIHYVCYQPHPEELEVNSSQQKHLQEHILRPTASLLKILLGFSLMRDIFLQQPDK